MPAGAAGARSALLAALWLWALPGVAAASEAPDLALKDLSGRERNVNEYIGRGRWAIVPVWSADCPVCRRVMYHMTFLYEQHKDKGIQVLGLSVDGYEQRDKVQDFVDEQSISFPTLIGAARDASRISGRPLRGTPTYYFFTPRGRFMTEHVGAMTQAQAERMVERLKKEYGSRQR